MNARYFKRPYLIGRRLSSQRCAASALALRPEFLARLAVQAFRIGLIRARLGDALLVLGAGRRRSRRLRRLDGGGDGERQDGREKCQRSHDASTSSKIG